jgi:antitoxin StbD
MGRFLWLIDIFIAYGNVYFNTHLKGYSMTRLLTNHIATMTEMREPHKVLAEAGGKPVAIMKNSRCVGYFVPAEIVNLDEPVYATREQVMESLRKRRAINQPVLDYLKDK